MATTKKKAAATPEEAAIAAQALTGTAPFKPRNIAAYEAAVEQFATATALFVRGEFAEARPLFEAVADAATPAGLSSPIARVHTRPLRQEDQRAA